MPDEAQGEVTRLLALWSGGDRAALDAATELVYAELRAIADAYVRREGGEITLQPTALIHEAYLRLAKGGNLTFENRRKFFALAAQLMRHILVDHARAARSQRRGGAVIQVPLNEAVDFVPDRAHEFLALNEALEELSRLSPRKAEVIDLRYFAGQDVENTAKMMGISTATVSRDQRMAEAWLSEYMSQSSESRND